MNSGKFTLPPRYKQCDSNLWLEYMDIVKKHNALNLGHGAPDFTAPKVLSDTLEKVSKGTDPVLHQYARDSTLAHCNRVPTPTNKFKLASKYAACEDNVWIEYGDLARKYKTLNLGQGASDFTAPKILTDALEEVSKCNDPALHQYARGFGHPRLVNILSKIYSPLINREINALDEIMIANGASEALYCAIIGFIHEGDEVIIMEPYFDCYEYLIRMALKKLKFNTYSKLT